MNGKKLQPVPPRRYKTGMKKSLFLAALIAAAPAWAQDAPIKVSYGGEAPGISGYLADKAIRQALDRADFAPQVKAEPGVLAMTVPEKVVHDVGEKATGFRFTLAFARDGDRVGEAQEICNSDKMDACAEQIAQDIKSADAVRR